jgi:hypothetical protein
MATLWHVGDVIELICEFDDSPTHLATLRRISWSFHRAVENVWTLLLGRQNSVIGDEQLDSIAHRYRPHSPAAVRPSESSGLVQIVCADRSAVHNYYGRRAATLGKPALAGSRRAAH